jgi:type VI secretion system secreted protein VgrG
MDPFLLKCDAIQGRTRVRALRGVEELGRCFEFEVVFTVDDEGGLSIDPRSVIGEAAALTIGDYAAQIDGRVAGLELLEDVPVAVFRMLLVPSLWLLRRSAHNRVFVDQSAPDIIKKVLEDAGIGSSAVEFRLNRSYAKRDHVCQYQESDLDFIERWMQREGIYYFFDHGDAGSKLIICDAPGHHKPIRADAIAYHPTTGIDESAGEHFRSFRASLKALAKEVVQADYNYLTPDTKISATEAVAKELTAQVRRWAENEADGGGAKEIAKTDAERELSRRNVYLAKGRAFAVHSGFTFSLSRHPTADLNREYLAVRVIYRGQHVEQHDRIVPFFSPEEIAELGREVLQIEAEAIASDVQFRPARRTPWPRVAGLELGLVDGPADGEYAQLDEHGRYLVKLMMDENSSPAGKASTRVRMIQPHGGSQEGFHFPLRKGTEVLLAFIGGDPDRPVIAGAIPNAHTPSPVTRANGTQNVVQTGGLTRIEMEDTEGGQYVDISTPPENTYLHLGAHAGLGDHNLVLSTDGDGLIYTGGNRDITIGGDQNEDVKGNVTEHYHADQSTHVAAAFKETVDAGATQTIHAGLTQSISGGLTQTIDGGEQRAVSGGVTETVNGSRTQTINGSTTESISSTQTQTITGGAAVTTAATYTVKADGSITLQTPAMINMMASSWTMNAAGGQTNLDFYATFIASIQKKYYDVLFQPNAVAITLSAISIGIIGSRRDSILQQKMEAAGVVIQNNGTKCEGGIQTKFHGAASIYAGFLMFL